MSSIAELIIAFQNEDIDADKCLAGLQKHVKSAEQKQVRLGKLKVPEEDQAQWDTTLKPGLDTAYEGIIGAGTEAQAFVKSGDTNLLEGIFALLNQVDHILNYIGQLSGLSAETEQLLNEQNPLQDGFTAGSGAVQGSAESQVSFLND